MNFERLWRKEGGKGTPLSCLTNDLLHEDQIKEGWVFFFFALFGVWCWSNKAVLRLNAQLVTVIQELEKLSGAISVICFSFLLCLFVVKIEFIYEQAFFVSGDKK